jgi:hypothetical protein
MSKFLKRLFRIGSAPSPVQLFVTIDKVHALFAYGRDQGCQGLGLSEDEVMGPQRLMDWQADTKDWTILVASKSFAVGDEIVIPPHIKWSNNPHFRYIGIVNGALEFRTGDNGESAWFLANVTSNPEVVEEISAFFKFWYDRLQLQHNEQPTEQPIAGLASLTRDTPIRGFKVITVIYPNHKTSKKAPYTVRELARLLSRTMDINWFAKTPEFEHFAVTDVSIGSSRDEDAFGFDFGPFDQDSGEFLTRSTVIVRETAGGGMMLLVEETAYIYNAKLKTLYEELPEAGHRLPEKRR